MIHDDPQIRRMLAEQRASGLQAAVGGFFAVAKAGGPAMIEGRRDLGGARRAAKSFGLTGAEICQCGRVGCLPCEVAGTAPGMSVCQDDGCATCAQAMGVVFEKREARGKLPWWPVTPGRLLPDREVYFDAHSHLFPGSEADWEVYKATGAFPSFGEALLFLERVGRLAAFQAVGVDRMVISGFYDDTGPEPSVDGVDLDLTCAWAWSILPDYFVPLTRGFANEWPDLDDWRAPLWEAVMLSYGFAGVGELIVHGHDRTFTDNDALESICEEARQAGAPIAMHWEIFAHWRAGLNYNQLVDLLDRFGGGFEFRPLRFILCHVGLGPDESSAEDVADFSASLDDLISRYPHLYFDFSGLQVGSTMKLLDSSDSLTDFGSMLLEKMAAYPRRFLFGIDTETKYSQGSAAAWEDSVEKYELFLDKGSLTIADKRMIKYTNAVGLFS